MEKFGALFLYDLVSGSLFLGIWVLHVEYGTLDSSGGEGCNGWFDSGYGVLRQYLAFGRISHNLYALGTLETLLMASSWLTCVIGCRVSAQALAHV